MKSKINIHSLTGNTGTVDIRNRGHKYKLFIPSCSSSARHNFYTYRAAKIWNYLPADTTDFSSPNSFKRSLNSKVFVKYCKVYFF